MLGRKTYEPDEVSHARTAVRQQLTAYRALAGAARTGQAQAAAEALEPVVFSKLVLALDRYFVHRLRIITGKDGHPLNELEMLADSLMNHDGLLTTSTVIRYLPAETALKLQIGEADHAVRRGVRAAERGVLHRRSSAGSATRAPRPVGTGTTA